jgi:hypothetical protein
MKKAVSPKSLRPATLSFLFFKLNPEKKTKNGSSTATGRYIYLKKYGKQNNKEQPIVFNRPICFPWLMM